MIDNERPSGPRRDLKRAACLLMGYRDSLTPEAAASLQPFGKLLETVVTGLDWACPSPPSGELTEEHKAEIENARVAVDSLLRIAKMGPDHFAAMDLVLSEIAELLAEAG